MKKLLHLLTLAVWLIGCTKYEEPPPTVAPSEKKIGTRSAIVSADNPYSLTNVQLAMDDVCDEMAIERIALHPTHYYVRFMPKDTLEYDRLVDLDLMLFSYPLDRELTDEEVEFYKNDLTEYGYPWQYTKVPTDYVFPEGIIHEILDEVVVETFTPGDINEGVSNSISAEVWDNTLIKTLKIPEAVVNARASYKWTPYAKVTYVDDFDNKVIPLAGVRVRCQNGLHFDRAYTDRNGEATEFGEFKSSARYEILWNDNYWYITDGGSGQASFTGPDKTGRWEVNIAGDTYEAMHAAIHRACFALFYDNPFDITTPTQKRVKIKAFYGKSGDVNGNFNGSSIRIFRITDGGGRPRSRWEMTSTSCHELGHAVHNRFVDLSSLEKIHKESWATGVQFAFMNWLYPNQVERIRYRYSSDYTGIVEWLLNQGLTLRQIEQIVVNVSSWDEWRWSVKSLGIIDNVIVDLLFDNPSKLWAANFKELISGTSQIYTGMDITYSLPPTEKLYEDITISDWVISGDGYTILEDNRTGRSIKLRFNTIGERTLTARIKLLDGTIYEVHKKINVTPQGTITGASGPRTGVQMTYVLSGYSGEVDQWLFTGLTSDNYWEVSSTNNSVTVVFKTPGTTTIKAMIQNSELAIKSVTVPNDVPITSFIAYTNQAWPYDVWLKNQVSGTPPGSYSYAGQRKKEPETSKRHFMAYATRPSSAHPHYSLVKSLYENGYHYGKYAYDQRIYSEFTLNGIKAWIFRSQHPGTVPLYLVEYTEFTDETMNYAISYVTLENLSSWRNVHSWYWNWLGTKKLRDRNWMEQKNWGIMGYVYPYKP